MPKTKIILTGGGTAGHISPIIAIAQILKKQNDLEFVFFGSASGPEKKIALEFKIPFRGLIVGKWRPYFSLLNIWDLFKTFIGLFQAFFSLIFSRPKIIFAKGGYVTFPILFWARIFKIPVVIHESDVVMGKANRWAAQFAKKICVGFPVKNYNSIKNIPFQKLIYTGIPIRPEFFQKDHPIKDKPVVLITGGSQGAAKINQLIIEILPSLLEKYEIYHLCGEVNFKKLIAHKPNNPAYHLIAFTNDLPKLMQNADLVVSRAGANTLMEIAAQKKPVILIPFPAASLDHQTANAKVFEEFSAAKVLIEKNLTGQLLLSMIDRLMQDANEREKLGQAIGQFSQPNAAQNIVNILLEEK